MLIMTIAFLGDSITADGQWDAWFPGRDARNLGIPGDTTADVLDRLDDCIDAGPGHVYLLIGTNDLGNESRSVEHVVANAERILAGLRAALPATEIVLQSVLPRAAEFAERITALNAGYRALAGRYRARYLDLWPAFAGGDGELLPELTDDRLHLLPSGYRRWLEVLGPVVNDGQAAATGRDAAPPILSWLTPGLSLRFAIDQDAPVALRSIRPTAGDSVDDDLTAQDRPTLDQRLVEISAIGHGRFPGSFRHVDTILGAALRYHSHTTEPTTDGQLLRLVQQEATTGLRVTSVFRTRGAISAFQTWTEVDIDGDRPITLDFVSTFATGAFLTDSGAAASGAGVDDFDLLSAENDWLAESRWRRAALRERGLVEIDRPLHGYPPRSRCTVGSRGSWSTGEALPTGALLSRTAPYALAWQVEHNGPWTYEIGENRYGAYLLLTGPTDQDHQWSLPISAGNCFSSVPASVAVAAGGLDEVFAVLTQQRRALRLPRDIDRTLPVVFNDYMNTLMGDPTTDQLLPLIDAAADAGVDYFCIDAGWYAEGHWWDTVGAWRPAESRFPGGGLIAVLDHIRARGMQAGLWLEPEVIGIHSQLAASLPDAAFFSRRGIRIAEHGRHLLDLRHPAALAHLDEVLDRIVGEYGVRFIKMDYNTMTGPGTDSTGSSPGHGLLEHNRALLGWIDRVQARHPMLIIENCASGAMRMDYAMLSRLHLQSTSDQQDPVLYAPIAAAAPASILPEQAGNWAYPRAGMEPELLTLSLVNGILGRMYLSGYLNRMSDAEIAVVREAIIAQQTVLATIEQSIPFWPLGLPGWTDGWVALGLGPADAAQAVTYLSVWRRPGAPISVVLPLPALRGQEPSIDPFFPGTASGWDWRWDADSGELTVTAGGTAPTARVLRISRRHSA
jgi:alpha-galactosidase